MNSFNTSDQQDFENLSNMTSRLNTSIGQQNALLSAIKNQLSVIGENVKTTANTK